MAVVEIYFAFSAGKFGLIEDKSPSSGSTTLIELKMIKNLNYTVPSVFPCLQSSFVAVCESDSLCRLLSDFVVLFQGPIPCDH